MRLRIIVGTTATRVARSSSRSCRKPFAANFSRGSRQPPFKSVRSATQMPKLKVMLRTSSVRSLSPKERRLWIASSLPMNARCESTAPFGMPEEPEVNTMSAAPSRIGRGGGGALEMTLRNRSHSKRARVFAATCVTAPGGEERCTGTTTPPASHTPAYAARSSGWLEMRTCTGSLAARAARDNESRTAWAANCGASTRGKELADCPRCALCRGPVRGLMSSPVNSCRPRM